MNPQLTAGISPNAKHLRSTRVLTGDDATVLDVQLPAWVRAQEDANSSPETGLHEEKTNPTLVVLDDDILSIDDSDDDSVTLVLSTDELRALEQVPPHRRPRRRSPRLAATRSRTRPAAPPKSIKVTSLFLGTPSDAVASRHLEFLEPTREFLPWAKSVAERAAARHAPEALQRRAQRHWGVWAVGARADARTGVPREGAGARARQLLRALAARRLPQHRWRRISLCPEPALLHGAAGDSKCVRR